ncbi:lytic murein transglycosylase [Desulfococcaceae bacterium HSG9]|nr:lytic murein transglycosylase [Desulfococcaceae bacterium HSG9]
MIPVKYCSEKIRQILVYFLFTILIIFPCTNATAGKDDARYFNWLETKLIEDGFDADMIKNLFKNPKLSFNVKDVSLFFVHSESRLNYNQYLHSPVILLSKKYIQAHLTELETAEKRYGVDKEIITAIILVETNLGTLLGKSHVFSTLATMASLSEPQLKEKLWRRIPAKRRLARKRYDKKVSQKAEWAYNEVKAFITYTSHEKIDPYTIYGSYAGAMGIAQFMPSNIMPLGRDGDNDGRVDLFNHADAIASIANYLKHYGWRSGINAKDAYKVIFKYNHSKPYVKTILAIAKSLKG